MFRSITRRPLRLRTTKMLRLLPSRQNFLGLIAVGFFAIGLFPGKNCSSAAFAQSTKTGQSKQQSGGTEAAKATSGRQKQKKQQPFRWVNKPKSLPEGVKHGTFVSPSMQVDVGYCIYLPPAYEQQAAKRFPVVYYLHGGRPGSEAKSLRIASFVHQQISAGDLPPVIYVFVNGGPVSHYNMPNRKDAQGADVFVKELIPHIDGNFRTIADRKGRGIEGFSQGGRGTTRLAFRYPELFCSAAPGGAGHATEKRISMEGGRESDTLVFAEGDNTYDLARKHAASPEPKIAVQIHVGTKGFNYENNLAYMEFLDSLKIPYTKVIVEGAPHSAAKIYEAKGPEIMRFHAKNFGLID